tara:strand:+ start:22925 stop:23188 length:264 start_codon:yes stop_codon:yes gene_type:complete
MDLLISFVLGSMIFFFFYTVNEYITRKKNNEEKIIRFLKSKRNGQCRQYEVLISIGGISDQDFQEAINHLYKKGLINLKTDWISLRK